MTLKQRKIKYFKDSSWDKMIADIDKWVDEENADIIDIKPLDEYDSWKTALLIYDKKYGFEEFLRDVQRMDKDELLDF